MTDGHCATDSESIYVQLNTTICTTTASSSGGTKTQPFCSMDPVATALAPGRDLVVVNGTGGTITGGSWTYANQVGAQLSIVGKQNPAIGSVSIPAFGMQSGTVSIRSVTFQSLSSMGISASGGKLALDHVTVINCGGGGILLNNAAFDIENTTVKNNGPSSDLTWGGIESSSVAGQRPGQVQPGHDHWKHPVRNLLCFRRSTNGYRRVRHGECFGRHQRNLQHHGLYTGHDELRIPTITLDARCTRHD